MFAALSSSSSAATFPLVRLVNTNGVMEGWRDGWMQDGRLSERQTAEEETVVGCVYVVGSEAEVEMEVEGRDGN